MADRVTPPTFIPRQGSRRRTASRTVIGMVDKSNDSYVIVMGTKDRSERYYRDEKGWLKVSMRGRVFRMTAEQVLNHLLPAVAGLASSVPGFYVRVEHHPKPKRKDG